VWHWKYYKALRCYCENLWNVARNFWHSSPRWWEVSDPIQTNSIDRLWTQPYHFTMRKSFFCLGWKGSLNLKMSILFPDVWKKAALCQEPNESFGYYCACILTAITLDNIWLSSKFHLFLCVEHQFLKNKFCVLWDTKSDISVKTTIVHPVSWWI